MFDNLYFPTDGTKPSRVNNGPAPTLAVDIKVVNLVGCFSLFAFYDAIITVQGYISVTFEQFF